MKKQFLMLSLLMLCALHSHGQFDFTSGNIVVVRVGNGEELSSSGNRVFLEEYDTTGTKVQSIALPYTGDNKLILDGTDEFCGYLNRSSDNKYLTLAGFDATIGAVSDLDESDPSDVNRMVAVVGVDASIDLSTRYSNIVHTPQGACSTDGDSLWLSATSFSTTTPLVYFGTKGATTNTAVFTFSGSSKLKVYNVKIFSEMGNDMLFYSYKNGAGGVRRFYNENLPTSSTDNKSGGPNGVNTNDYVLLDKSSSLEHLDIGYCVNAFGGSYGLCKQSQDSGFIGTGYDLLYFSDTPYAMDTCKYYGITLARNSENASVLYATRYNGATGVYQLVKIIDNSGWEEDPEGKYSIEVLASAATGTAFRGVALAPISKSSQYIVGLESIVEKEYVDSTFTLPAQTSAGLDISYTVEDESVLSMSGSNTFTILKVDTTTITAIQEGNDDYLPLDKKTFTVNIDKSYQYVEDWELPESMEFSNNSITLTVSLEQEDFDVTPSLNSKLDFTMISENDAIVSVSGNTFHIGGTTGTAAVYLIQEGNEYYYPVETEYDIYSNYFKIKVQESSTVESSGKELFHVYPNPVSANYLQLTYENLAYCGSYVSLINIQGQIQLRQTIVPGSTECTLDLSDLAEGLYYLVFFDNTGKVYSKKIVRQ